VKKNNPSNKSVKQGSGISKIIRYTLLTFNLLLAFALLLSYLSVYVSPENIWFLSLLGLAYPYLLLLNLFFMIFWIYRLNKFFLISLFVMLIGWSRFITTIGMPVKKELHINANADTIKLMTYNVHGFSYDRKKRVKPYSNSILSYANSNKADVLCFQEFYTEQDGYYSEREINKRLKKHKYHHTYYIGDQKKGGFGIATYSKYPIIYRGSIIFYNTPNCAIYSDILIGNDTVRIYNVHLQSIRFKKHNIEFLDTLKLDYSEKHIDELMDISRTMKEASVKRAEQARVIARHIELCKHPVIVCGDFNDPPVSYTYRKMSHNLADAFMRSGWGIGSTYHGPMPSFRIDYILHSKQFISMDYRRIKFDYSDHFPVECRIIINN
jgi:endonuclease/exonuclease/phosphatase family metal-dependent hydrolase